MKENKQNNTHIIMDSGISFVWINNLSNISIKKHQYKTVKNARQKGRQTLPPPDLQLILTLQGSVELY